MIRDFFNTLYRHVSKLITPPFCAGCSLFLSDETVFCKECWSAVTPVAPLKVPVTATKIMYIHALGSYTFPLKKLILGKNTRSIASSALLGHALWNNTLISSFNFDYVVPIPLHWTRKTWRGFNQAEEIARVIAKKADTPLINALIRDKKTKFQAECSKAERAYNMVDALSLATGIRSFNGKSILLVDDLTTTGTTLMHASKILYKAGARTVIAVVGARVI